MVIFKRCSNCGKKWKSAGEFFCDPSVEMIGFQESCITDENRLALFNHCECGTSLAIDESKLASYVKECSIGSDTDLKFSGDIDWSCIKKLIRQCALKQVT